MRIDLWTIGTLCLLLAAPAAGQEHGAPAGAYRSGLWIAYGLAAGHARIDCGGCDLEENDALRGGTGHSGYFAVGGTPRRNLLVGGEINFWVLRSSSTYRNELWGSDFGLEREALLGTASVAVQLYPASSSRLFVRAGGGMGVVSATTDVQMPLGWVEWEEVAGGLSVHAGVGYDLVVHGSIALVPFAGVVQILNDSARWHVGSSPRSPRYLQAGVAIARY
jgi:hypothetical protein